MKKLANQSSVSTVVAPLFSLASESGQRISPAELHELTFAEIASVAGGPEGEVGAGVIPPL